MTEIAAIGTFVKLTTMADGTPRVTLDLSCSLSDAAMVFSTPGDAVAIARLTVETAKATVNRIHFMPSVSARAEGVDATAPTTAPTTEEIKDEEERESASENADAHEKGEMLSIRLHRLGFFLNPKLWDAMEQSGLYKQSEHKKFVESLPCLYSPPFPSADLRTRRFIAIDTGVTCLGDNAANSGTSFKPPHWFTVPLCIKHHAFAHSKDCDRATSQKILEAAIAITATKVKEAVKKHFGIESLNDMTELQYADLCRGLGVQKL